MEVLFKTRHGSRLYGMAHEFSDDDWYTVVIKPPTNKKKFSTHTIVDNDDSVVVDFGTWLTLCEKGVPQALEAMFSGMAVTDKVPALRAGFRVSTGVYETYLRTIKSFAMADTFKSKRHALRLALNLRDILHYGRFDPTLTPDQVAGISRIAKYSPEAVYRVAQSLVWS